MPASHATVPLPEARTLRRLVILLSEPDAFGRMEDGRLIVYGRRKAVTLQRASFEAAAAEALLSSGSGARMKRADGGIEITLTDAGRAESRRIAAGNEGFLAQHREIEAAEVEITGEKQKVAVNLRESPLLWLRRRRGKEDSALIEDAHIAAAERFRLEFERSGLMQRTTIDWSRLGAATQGGRGAEPTDVMLSSRRRVHQALDAIGPELSGPIIDLVCFHKGLEEMEREHGWPARSGKLALRLALSALARHYGLDANARGPANSSGIRRWRASASDAPGLAPYAVHE